VKYRIVRVNNLPTGTQVSVELDVDLREFLGIDPDFTPTGPREVATLTYDFPPIARESLILSSIRNDIAQRKSKAVLERARLKAVPSGPSSDLAHLAHLKGRWFDA
jgi:hypothetical protein